MKHIYLLVIISVFLISFISATNNQYSDCNVYGTCKTGSSITNTNVSNTYNNISYINQTYNDTWINLTLYPYSNPYGYYNSSTLNSTAYLVLNASGLIKDWNASGWITNQTSTLNSTGLIINWSSYINSSGILLNYSNVLNGTGLIKNWSAVITASPANPNKSIQFNWNGVFSGTSGLIWDNVSRYLSLKEDNAKLTLGADDDVMLYFNGNSTIFKGYNYVEDLPLTEQNTLFLQGFSNIFWNDSEFGNGTFSLPNVLTRVNFNTKYDAQSAQSLTTLDIINGNRINREDLSNDTLNYVTNKSINWKINIPNTDYNRFGNPIELSYGWTHISFTNFDISKVDSLNNQNVTLSFSASNYSSFGWSSKKRYSIFNANVTYSNGTVVPFQDAYGMGHVSLPKKIFTDRGIGTATPPSGQSPVIILEPNTGYYINTQMPLNITFYNAGGAFQNTSIVDYSLSFSNGASEGDLDFAIDNNWIYPNAYEWTGSGFTTRPLFATTFYPWKGYFFRAKVPGIRIYTSEKNLTNYSLNLNYTFINSNNKLPNNITYFLNGGNFTMLPGVSQYIQNWNSSSILYNYSSVLNGTGLIINWSNYINSTGLLINWSSFFNSYGIKVNNINVTTNANISGNVIVGGGLNVTGNVHIDGNLSVKRPYGMFSSNLTQVIAVANTAQVINWSHTEDAYLVTDGDGENFTILQTGDYKIDISAIVSTSLPNKHVEIWLQKWNGSWYNIPRSNTKVEITSATTETLIVVPFIIDYNLGEKFRFMWASDDSGTELVYTTNTSYSPETPSIIMTISKISELTD